MRLWLLGFCMLVVGCATNPPIPLQDRFEAVAFGRDVSARLWRWERPIRPEFIGTDRYRPLVERHFSQISEITGLPVEFDSDEPNVTIEFSRRRDDVWCEVEWSGSTNFYYAKVYIDTSQSAHHLLRCIPQELTQFLGLFYDTDGRTDTTFSSAIGTNYLTGADIQLLRVLYDPRLEPGMIRSQVHTILPEIVADVEAAQATAK